MIVSLLIAVGVSTASPAAAPGTSSEVLKEAVHAIDSGRLDQARLMILRAVAAGAPQREVDRALAQLTFASGKNAEALAQYERLITTGRLDAAELERGGIAALRLGARKRAAPFVTLAISRPHASWRAWNAQGVLADLDRDWTTADAAYQKAAQLAPQRAELVNNQGWSRLLRGNWSGAADYFEHAAALDPKSARIANNLEIARAALAVHLPQRRAGESDRDWAARLNDAGVVARLLGDKKRAIAAFTQALEASGTWYARAANNLEATSAQ